VAGFPVMMHVFGPSWVSEEAVYSQRHHLKSTESSSSVTCPREHAQSLPNGDTYLPTYLLTYQPTYLPANLPTHLPTY
jgi:hypothetical protein